jgi:hypothetical protein
MDTCHGELFNTRITTRLPLDRLESRAFDRIPRYAAVLSSPEEDRDVKTAIGAARAKKARKEML